MVVGALLAAFCTLAGPAMAQAAPRSPQDTVVTERLVYPMSFDTVETYLQSLIPPEGQGNVRNLELSAERNELRVDSEVRIGAIPGFELLSPLGWARLTAIGPMRVVRRGVVAWEVRTMLLGGKAVAPAMWEPLLHIATRRDDTLVPFRVGQWVQQVDIEPDRLVLR
jgi:hypothetical protein